MYRRLSIFCCLLLLFAADVSAQWEILQKVDSFLVKMQHTNIDTNYIMRPKERLTIRLLNNFSGATVHYADRSSGSQNMYLSIKSDMKWTISSSINYRGISVALAVNPGHVFDWYHDMEFNINAYGNKMGADFIYQHSRGMRSELEIGDYTRKMPKDYLVSKSINANYYYVFNNRRFSFPAAFTQSYVQKRSAGSFIVGASFQSLVMDVGKQYRILDDQEYTLFNTKLLGIGGGYAYNIVPNHNWMIHLSVMPTIVVWRDMNMENDGYTARGSHPFSLPNMLTTARVSAIHYFGKQFTGVTAVLNHSHLGQSGADMFDHLKWRVRLLYGIRFW